MKPDTVPTIDLSQCLVSTASGLYIDPNKVLQYLSERAILLAERTAQPKLDAVTTELLRGHRQEAIALLNELKKVIKNVEPTTE